ncbi:hypothetical protein CKO25_17095 [Thiocapsa imhoffii]|uniref:Uncharacterized protein n=1 Tax=Thiocapsa imhoffii TaxID=382777 RepID=A0A9X0WKQ6_9GAMM|nr:hypothetical protein [Thiocapsa imhoffii]
MVARALDMTPEVLRASFQPARLHHLASITALRHQVIGSHQPRDDAGYLQWRYDFEGRGDGHGNLMVVARGDQVLGMIGTESVRLAKGQETLDALSLMDIMVDPQLDGTGLGVWLNLAIFASHPVVFEIGANPNSLGLITRLFHRLPNRKQYVTPLSMRRYLAKRLRSPAVAAALAVPTDALLNLWRTATFRKRPASWSLRELTHFDTAVEHLFDRRWAAQEITFQRTRDYLNWRLFENPRARYSVLGAFEGENMVGYMAYQIDGSGGDVKVVRLVDWLVDDRWGFDGFRLLVQEIVRHGLAVRADLVNLSPLHARIEHSLWRLGFVTLPSNEFATVGVRCADPIPWPALLDGAAWCLTDANTDFDCT